MEDILVKYKKELIKLEIYLLSRSHEVDPHNQYDWHDLCLGFLMGQGVSQDDAMEILTYITY